MNAPPERTARPASRSPVRRIAAAVILSGLVFVVLLLTAFGVVTSLLISAGFCVVTVAACTVSDLIETVLDAIAAVIFGVLAAIAAVFAAIFGLFGF